MNKCKSCYWYGKEKRNKFENVFSGLVNSVVSISGSKEVVVCNRTNPAAELNNRVNACADFKEK